MWAWITLNKRLLSEDRAKRHGGGVEVMDKGAPPRKKEKINENKNKQTNKKLGIIPFGGEKFTLFFGTGLGL